MPGTMAPAWTAWPVALAALALMFVNVLYLRRCPDSSKRNLRYVGFALGLWMFAMYIPLGMGLLGVGELTSYLRRAATLLTMCMLIAEIIGDCKT